MRYYKFPKWSNWMFPGAIWDFSNLGEKSIYLTFDDGPHPKISAFILDLLDDFQAKGTFFYSGENVISHQEVMPRVLSKGHVIGNHGMRHLNGLKTNHDFYLSDIACASEFVNSNLFRPPYGKIKRKQYHSLVQLGYQVVFWSALSYDFDRTLSSEKRLHKMKELTTAGAIFVFHENLHAYENLKHELPLMLEFWKSNHYTLKAILNG